MAAHSSILSWRIPGTEEPSGLPSMGSHRVRHDRSDSAAAACMDIVVSITEKLSGFTTQFKEVTSECKSMHCVIHKEMLTNQKISPELNILQDALKIINHIRIYAPKYRQLIKINEKN